MRKKELAKITESGELPEHIRDEFKSFLYHRKGKWVEISYADKRTPKTENQLAYWFGVVVKYFSDATGYTIDEAHLELKIRAKYYIEKTVAGEKIRYVRSLSMASKDEMMDIIKAAKEWAAFLNIKIPEPDYD